MSRVKPKSPENCGRASLKNPRARELYYRGRDYQTAVTRQSIVPARELFEETILLEPESPYGYTAAASTHIWEAFYGWSGNPQASIARAGTLVVATNSTMFVLPCEVLALIWFAIADRSSRKSRNGLLRRTVAPRPTAA